MFFTRSHPFILKDEAASRAYIDLLWAEALYLYRMDPMNLKLSAEMEREVRNRQQMFIAEDVDAGMILAFMQETREDKVCSRMLFSEALGNGERQPLRWQTNDICEIMNQLIRSGKLTGWRAFNSPKRFRDGYGTQRGWERIPDNESVNKDVNRQLTLFDDFVRAKPGDVIPFLEDRSETPP